MINISPDISSISSALVVALGEMTDIRKNRKAKVPTKAGGSYEYSYADLADILQSVRPILAKHGLAVIQSVTTDGPDSVSISTTIIHSSGQWISTPSLDLPSGRTAQETGSAISYGRRYHLLATLGLAAEDDDGASARARGGSQKAPGGSRSPQERPERVSAPVPQKMENRTPEETFIRDIIGDSGPEVKAQFIEKWGRLIDLDPSKHEEALLWLDALVTGGSK